MNLNYYGNRYNNQLSMIKTTSTVWTTTINSLHFVKVSPNSAIYFLMVCRNWRMLRYLNWTQLIMPTRLTVYRCNGNTDLHDNDIHVYNVFNYLSVLHNTYHFRHYWFVKITTSNLTASNYCKTWNISVDIVYGFCGKE